MGPPVITPGGPCQRVHADHSPVPQSWPQPIAVLRAELDARAASRAASALGSPETQQLSPLDERVWAELMSPIRARWEGRAADESLTAPRRAYAHARARTLGRTYASKLDRCATSGLVVRCGCPGKRDVRWYTCRQHLVCERCNVQRSRKQAARIRAGLEAAAKTAARGTLAVLVTMSVRHTGDLQADNHALKLGWTKFRKAFGKRWGAFAYVGTTEVTPGRDGLGHVHLHVVALWPRVDWGHLHVLWRASCAESMQINFSASRSVRGAAKYVSKYVSKGVHTDDFSSELRARVVAGMYGARWVCSSRDFWVPFVPHCPGCGQCVVSAYIEPPWVTELRNGTRCHRWGTDPPGPERERGYQGAIEGFSEALQRPGVGCA